MTQLMRQSLIHSGDTCLLRINYDITEPNNKSSQARITGTACHAVLEHVYRSPTWERPEPELVTKILVDTLAKEIEAAGADGVMWEEPYQPTQAEQNAGAVAKEKGFEETLERCELYCNIALGNLLERDNYHSVLMVEETLTFPWITGWDANLTPDLVLMGNDGLIHIHDWKFPQNKWKPGREHARNTPQPTWYMYWVEQWFKQVYGEERTAIFTFDVTSLTLKQRSSAFERRAAFVTNYQRSRIFDKAVAYARLIENKGPFFPNQDSYLCSHLYCDYWDSCPYGEAWNVSA